MYEMVLFILHLPCRWYHEPPLVPLPSEGGLVGTEAASSGITLTPAAATARCSATGSHRPLAASPSVRFGKADARGGQIGNAQARSVQIGKAKVRNLRSARLKFAAFRSVAL